MPKLDKGTLALSFKFDCDRFLRFRLATDDEKNSLGIDSTLSKRPGIKLITDAGRQWESSKYEDLLTVYEDKKDEISYEKGAWDESLEIYKFNAVKNLFEELRKTTPPKIIIEGEFDVPTSITCNLQKAYDEYGLQQVRARPDILWIQPTQPNTPLIENFKERPKYEIHIIDVKMAAEPNLRHFTEVTYYALALSKALEKEGLNDKYAVVAEGKIWPGSHDIHDFKNKVIDLKASSEDDPINKALEQTLIPVPYEVYEIHVKDFFDNKLLDILRTNPKDAKWHVSNKCQLCDYLTKCKKDAEIDDHLSRVAWLNEGQAETLRNNNIPTVTSLMQSIKNKDDRWLSAEKNNHQLRTDSLAILARAQSLIDKKPIDIPGRKSALMPKWTNQSIYITVHFDPGTGITFALGAIRIYFPSERVKGSKPLKEKKLFIIDRVNNLTNPSTEKARLIEFASAVNKWMSDVSDKNIQKKARETSHFYFWNSLEIRQLKRMFERHMNDPAIANILEDLIKFFPPDTQQLQDPDAFKSQPGTIVKEVIKRLVGLPITHEYSLFEVANNFYPKSVKDNQTYIYKVPYGFSTPMSDQIPFERAYELWQDNIMLKHFDANADQKQWVPYTQDELRESLRDTIRTHLDALNHIVITLQQKFRDVLLLEKKGFSTTRSTQHQIPQMARNLITFEKLNVVAQEIENRNLRSMPVDEREARFSSIRGLNLLNSADSAKLINALCQAQSKYNNEKLYAFSFSKNSCDAKIKEGDFLLTLSHEDIELNFDRNIIHALKSAGFDSPKEVLLNYGINKQDINWLCKKNIDTLVQVTVLKMNTLGDPYIILQPCNASFFQFAIDKKFINLEQTLVLDPIFADFSTKKVINTFKKIGGKSAKIVKKKTKK